MKDGKLYALWGVLYIFCGLLGFIREPNGFVTALLVLLAVGFFVPGAVLLYRGYKARNPGKIKAICAVSLVWLVMTLVLLVLNFLTAGATALAGDLLYGFLVILSAPMFCGQAWVLSLFLWACLFVAAQQQIKRDKK